jgi:hypothetical protein
MFIHHYPIPRTGCDRIRYMASFSQVDPKKVKAIRQWCFEAFGQAGGRWQDDVYHGEIVFQREDDLMLFVLRWS